MVVGDAEDQRRSALEQSHRILRTVPRPGAYHRRVTATDPDRLRHALGGVRALILDADGVIVFKGLPIAGATEAIRDLTAKGIPFRVVTNFSISHRETLAARFMAGGLPITADRIITGASAAAAHTATTHAGQPLFVLAAADATREWDGQHVLTPDEAGAAEPGSVAAVVIADAGDDLSYRSMATAFRHIRAGSAFLAAHRNPWWLTPEGETLDAGAFVVGLEYGTGQRARIMGKPSPDVFRLAAAGLQEDLGGRLPRAAMAMVGDDLQADIAAAQRVGMKGILVLTGKTDSAEAQAALARRTSRGPDGIAPSLTEVVAALD
jgi:HAD superfamily hydrolase (TIGR01450 family)